ncbi:MAG: radical SAM protein [Anaerolineae bacterium]|jgi:putative pyruvate formate lyase activating enzyme|nr:radical SAM protein [Chloroflexota bacterium]
MTTQGGIWPGYRQLAVTGELAQRVEDARAMLRACQLCPRRCGVNRLEGQRGYCGAGALPRIASHGPHRWEEPPISGTRGSGTIFFSHCTARCLFCQNFPISQMGTGNDWTIAQLAEAMLSLQRRGCHNINLVTPTHYVAAIIEAVALACEQGLSIPLVYNTSGYESLETLALLDGLVDIYLPDSKYADDGVAQDLSGYVGYVGANRQALQEMARQVGLTLLLDDQGLARRGMVVRHLVLPGGLSQTAEVMAWLGAVLGPEVHVSLMAQYFAAHRAHDHPVLKRKLYHREYREALAAVEAAGLENGWRQELDRSY